MEEIIKYVIILLCFALLSIGLILIRKKFYHLANRTIGLLNTMLETRTDDSIKQKMLIVQTVKVIQTLLIFFSFLSIVFLLSLLPLMTYSRFDLSQLSHLLVFSPIMIISSVAGSLIPLLIFSNNRSTNYSASSRLLHHISLDYFNISRYLFLIEKRLYPSKTNFNTKDFIIVSGLARSGTTALTNLLYLHGSFSSLSYANMPFLLNPVSWKKVHNPTKNNQHERAHEDHIMLNYQSIEAFEEYFFRVQLHDTYISADVLNEHELNKENYLDYLSYIHLITDGNTQYLAKNNNLILRYRSLRKYNSYFKALFLFRNPVEHAKSLWTQHQNFILKQDNDPFILTYMNWLCHHEFGLNHKPFSFSNHPFTTSYERTSINYWIQIWIHYYQQLLMIIKEPLNGKLFLIHYEDLLNTPQKLISSLGKLLNLPVKNEPIPTFSSLTKMSPEIDTLLSEEAMKLYAELIQHRFRINSIEGHE